jgi:hypothetical protein
VRSEVRLGDCVEAMAAMDPEYAEIARRRIAHWSGHTAEPRSNGKVKAKPEAVAEIMETLF